MKTNENQKFLTGKKILVIATGSIAAVKTPLLISNLIKTGAEVRCVITESASHLVSPISISTLSRNRCFQDEDQWSKNEPKPLHISLAEWSDITVVAPLSASSLARWANGLGEGLAASLLLASEKPIIAAAAMNTGMWRNQAVKKNWMHIKSYKNVIALTPAEGLLACDRIGEGKMANINLIQLAIESASIQSQEHGRIHKDLEGINLLVSAGPTLEDIDSARYISNRSSGKMGILLAQAAKFRGADVDFVHGPLQADNELLEGLNNFQTRSAEDMLEILEKLQPSANAIAMAAAIADIKVKIDSAPNKLGKEQVFETLQKRLEIVPDLLKKLVSKKHENQIILGFTALAGNEKEIKHIALSKKKEKGCDLLFANPIDRENQGFESDFNSGWLIKPDETIEEMPKNFKFFLAHKLLDALKICL